MGWVDSVIIAIGPTQTLGFRVWRPKKRKPQAQAAKRTLGALEAGKVLLIRYCRGNYGYFCRFRALLG